MPSKHIISTVLSEENYNLVKRAADLHTGGNVSEMTRRLVNMGIDDYKAMERFGIIRIGMAIIKLFSRRHRVEQKALA